ncbi:uncharacterized protein BDZ99DRAFT_521168 [Mytilinidion resinicola]|uniref:Rhodopsin domain-containing protein n=1 Tax=Mytilinidion resinicola TaxID=574789 RepID=A0A6A6YJC1_9PEZI|nr:uncharacterized protein BDZ99DRAFT_521168 [Mytilinidion resinicola]KAF2808669.1 hypothetical protein BDZ99DRAFT_521168 [Mytilinidion resinicola]
MRPGGMLRLPWRLEGHGECIVEGEVAATVFDTVQSGVVFHQVDHGYGNSLVSLSASNLRAIGKADFVSQIFYVFMLLLSKGAILFLYLRLSPNRSHAWASWATLGVSTFWFILSVILISVHCNPLNIWTDGASQCGNMFIRWQVIGAIDITTELAIFSISVFLVARLNMPTTSKLTVITAFSARLPVIAAAAVRLNYIHATFHSPNPSLVASYACVTTQWHLGYAIMASTISGLGPFLRPFAKSFSTHYQIGPGGVGQFASSASNSHAHSRSHASFAMASLSSKNADGGARLGSCSDSPVSALGATGSGPPLKLRPERVTQEVDIRHVASGTLEGDEERASLQSNDSRRMIITKKIQWSVDHDAASFRESGGQ